MSKKGFTLIELLIVITIIGILAALVVGSLAGAQKNARDGARRSNLEDIRSSLEVYRTDCSSYPAALTFGSPLTANCDGDSQTETYHSKLPVDPRSNIYNYVYRQAGSGYNLCANLEKSTGNNYNADCNSTCGGVCNYKVTNP